MARGMESKYNSIRKWYGIALSVLTAIVAILFIAQVWAIYGATDKNPYTVQSISEHFRLIAPFFYVWIFGILVGGVLWTAFPAPSEKTIAYIDPKQSVERLKKRVPNASDKDAIWNKYAYLRNVFRISAYVCAIGAIVMGFVLLLGDARLETESEFFAKNVAAGKLVLCMPWLFMTFALFAASALFENFALQREKKHLSAEIAENAKKGIKVTLETQKNVEMKKSIFAFTKSEKYLLMMRISLAVIGVALVIVGILNGGMRDVLMKAINICKQCIGLG